MTMANDRTADYPIDPMFLRRWSPRASNAEELPERNLLTMLEAARWAASSYNSQPWRFVYARRDMPPWDRFLNLLVPANQAWAKHASALVILLSNTAMRPPGSDKDVPSPTHSFDAGTASGLLRPPVDEDGLARPRHDRVRPGTRVRRIERAPRLHGRSRLDDGCLGDPANLPEQLRPRRAPGRMSAAGRARLRRLIRSARVQRSLNSREGLTILRADHTICQPGGHPGLASARHPSPHSDRKSPRTIAAWAKPR